MNNDRPTNPSRLLTSQEVSKLLSVDQSSVNGWARNGQIRACKTPGGHNRFELQELLRFLEDSGRSIPEELRSAPALRLLVVDDDKRELARWKRGVRRMKQDIALLCVDNGIEALVQVGAFRPDMVVLDLVMPGIDGIEVCRRLKAMPDIGDVEVVLVSGALTDDMARAAHDAGARAAWSKPQPIANVLSLILPPMTEAKAPKTR